MPSEITGACTIRTAEGEHVSKRDIGQRVVITGMGALTPLGLTVEETWAGLVAGRSGIGPVTLFDASNLPVRIAGEVKGFDPGQYMDIKEARRIARFSQLAVAIGVQAMADAGLGEHVPDPERAGVVMGVGVGGVDMVVAAWDVYKEKGLRRVSPFSGTGILCNMPAHHLSLRFQCQGHNSTVVTACAAGTQAIGEAAEQIRRGVADLILAGGVDTSVSEVTMGGFCAMRALAADNDHPEQACKPFDARRDGFVCADGGAVLVLERLDKALDRGARIYGEVLGYSANSDAFHVAAPDPEGAGAARAMRWALKSAQVLPAEIDYINAHGTGTEVGDPAETLAIKKVFGEHASRLPISSTKSMIGHSLGGAGAIEAMACVKTIVEGVIHPTINYEVPDPACDLDYVPNRARRAVVRTTLSNSFGLGGQNACLVLSRFEE
jgi:3-oxoacyl-[acyl-carrier-protein] synthase II